MTKKIFIGFSIALVGFLYWLAIQDKLIESVLDEELVSVQDNKQDIQIKTEALANNSTIDNNPGYLSSNAEIEQAKIPIIERSSSESQHSRDNEYFADYEKYAKQFPEHAVIRYDNYGQQYTEFDGLYFMATKPDESGERVMLVTDKPVLTSKDYHNENGVPVIPFCLHSDIYSSANSLSAVFGKGRRSLGAYFCLCAENDDAEDDGCRISMYKDL
jgi:hypothetical protein